LFIRVLVFVVVFGLLLTLRRLCSLLGDSLALLSRLLWLFLLLVFLVLFDSLLGRLEFLLGLISF
jgi:hypothetical protein